MENFSLDLGKNQYVNQSMVVWKWWDWQLNKEKWPVFTLVPVEFGQPTIFSFAKTLYLKNKVQVKEWCKTSSRYLSRHARTRCINKPIGSRKSENKMKIWSKKRKCSIDRNQSALQSTGVCGVGLMREKSHDIIKKKRWLIWRLFANCRPFLLMWKKEEGKEKNETRNLVGLAPTNHSAISRQTSSSLVGRLRPKT